MKNFSVADLARIIKVSAVFSPPFHDGLHAIRDTQCAMREFTGVSIDSRTTKAGDCFFAIAGPNFDGHNFLVDAFAKGAVCAVVSRELKNSKLEIRNSKFRIQNSKIRYCLLKVEDTVKVLGDFAREYRRQAGFKVVAITGSVGKTTTRHIACYVLSRHFRVFESPGNFNNNIGLPLTLLEADPQDQIVIAELGANHPGEIAYLTRIALPDIAVVTNVHPAHLEGFGDLETIVQEKLSIAEGLPDNGVLIINADIVKWLNSSSLNYKLPITNHQVTTFGKSDNADYRASNIASDGFGSRFAINGTEVYLPLPGPGNIENALAACAVCSRLGLTIGDFAKAVSAEDGLAPLSMRAEVLQIGTLTILNDCYNANPASMKNALDILAALGSSRKGRLVFICGDMAELGQQSELLHAELGESIAKAKVQLLLAVGKFANITAQAAKRTADSTGHELQIECFEDALSACNNLQKFIKDYDIILVKGSRAVKLEVVVEKLKTQNQ
jgi:UDP-N-acetylmuramoyl-tripeptide--D-alanyl-D-alanine ligase